MPTVADYDIVSDAEITLSLKGVSSHRFPLETPGINVDVRAVLSFMVTTGGTLFDMSIINSRGEHGLGRIEIVGAAVCALQKVIGTGILQPKGNTLLITVRNGFGTFNEIVLWYQTNV